MGVSLAHKVVTPGIIVWDLETVPDLTRFAAENDLVGKSNVEIRGESFRPLKNSPNGIYGMSGVVTISRA
jgi:hypothetical protein